jgi:hypothetical protein
MAPLKPIISTIKRSVWTRWIQDTKIELNFSMAYL